MIHRNGGRNTWQEFVSGADEREIWNVNKYFKSLPSGTYILTLEGEAVTNEQRTDILRTTFFQSPPLADLSDRP